MSKKSKNKEKEGHLDDIKDDEAPYVPTHKKDDDADFMFTFYDENGEPIDDDDSEDEN